MSTRHVRKLLGGNELPPPDSDEDYEPHAKGGLHKFDGLVFSSGAESDDKASDDKSSDENKTEEMMVKKKKKNKKKKKAKNNTNANQVDDLDEIDRSVLEVNQILGAVAIAPSTSGNDNRQRVRFVHETMTIHHRDLTVTNELKRMFGPEVTEENRDRNRGRQSIMDRLSRKMYLIQPRPFLPTLSKLGLSMSVNRRENGLIFFTYDHDEDYQKFHRQNMVANLVLLDFQRGIFEAKKRMYVEGLITAMDTLFQMEQNTNAVQLLEMAVAYLQLTAHPSFILYDPKVRLEYKFVENRPFFIVMLKYIHLLTNTACHRTALELAKVLLNLEPSDPLAILQIIDVIALRAREHQWLIKAIDYWKLNRNADKMPNMMYSYAMSHFHVLSKNNEDLAPADKLLQDAIIKFPTVAFQLIQRTNMRADDTIKKHQLITSFADTTSTKVIKDLSHLYAKFSCHKWREPPVLKWFTRNVVQLLEEMGSIIPDSAVKAANERCNLFHSMAPQVGRHFIIIKNMASLLIDNEMPAEIPNSFPWNPLPERVATVQRYYSTTTARQTSIRETSALWDAFRSIAPTFGFTPRHDADHVMLAHTINHILDNEDEAADAFELVLPSGSDSD